MSLKHRKKPTSDADLVEQTNETDVVEKARGIFKSDKALLALLVAFRLINAALCRTWFVADEYWQSLEVAHRMVFGYGYLTWEWKRAARGYTHPLVFAALYKLLDMLGLDNPWTISMGPRVLQSLLAAVGDLYVFKLASSLFGAPVAPFALLCNLFSWFTFYAITRTLSNSIETSLFPAVLLCWLKATQESDVQKIAWFTRLYLLLAAVTTVLRSTTALLWPVLIIAHLWRRWDSKWRVAFEVMLVGCLSLGLSMALDMYCYGRFVLVQWEFVRFNILEGHSALYGTHPWHWYFTECAPVITFTLLPLFLLGVWYSSPTQRVFFYVGVWLLVSYSILGHKELRYIMALLPIASVYAGYFIHSIIQKGRPILHGVVWMLLCANVPMALYFSLVHQAGTTAVMEILRKEITPHSSVMFLMPCHSTPFYSHIHQNITMQFLECNPPINPDSKDISKDFYASPLSWLASRYQDASSLPSHLVMFNSLVEDINHFLDTRGYSEVARVFHSHFPEDKRYGSHVLLFERKS
ncbi:hypothetical protein EMCRGX_G021505 [Ephydatia muelleri]